MTEQALKSFMENEIKINKMGEQFFYAFWLSGGCKIKNVKY